MTKVMIINNKSDYDSDEESFPPVGTIGFVTTPLDECDEYDILFPEYPCPAGPDISWITHKNMVVIIDDGEQVEELTEVQYVGS